MKTKVIKILADAMTQVILFVFVASLILSLMMVVAIAEGNLFLILPLAILCGIYYVIYRVLDKYSKEKGDHYGN